jgi:hypothetical protein
VARAVIITIMAAVGLASVGVYAAGPRLPLILIGVLAVAIASLAVVVALLRGAARHTVVAWSPSRVVTRDEMLPLPAAPAPAALPPARHDPFTADGPAWAELIEQAEREELLRQGPREARVIAPSCEGPGCAALLDKNPWRVRAEAGGVAEVHSFCSGECAEEWQARDSAARS